MVCGGIGPHGNNGVSRYDGMGFVDFTTQDGLANNGVNAIYRDPDGVLWFGTWGGGVSRYDEGGFVNFTKKDGLASHGVNVIRRAPDGSLWFGTWGSGISLRWKKVRQLHPKRRAGG
ncbi:hypothetical protein HYR99_31525 [Candidatus Poribacteria bacterium]|nr:hypothetical protein [Candidatus Poribacteria bacterium]